MFVYQGERMRFGWGVAWRCYNRAAVVAYPIPLNFIARWGHDLWHYVATSLAWKPTKEEMVYSEGYQFGRKVGFNEGLLQAEKDKNNG